MNRLFLAFLGVTFFSIPVFATTINVPDDQSTIQAGINSAVNGDTVLVADGIYSGLGNKNIDYGGRAIVVISENGPEFCIIDCENSGRGFYFQNYEDSTSVLSGFTITNGYVETSGGGGIRICESSPLIENCIITGNNAVTGSGGIIVGYYNSHPIISSCQITENTTEGSTGGIRICGDARILNCIISRNTAPYAAGGIEIDQCSAIISGCIIEGNSASAGGGIFMYKASSPEIINCTIVNNSVSGNGSGILISWCEPSIVNTIVSGNTGLDAVYFDDFPTGDIYYCDFYDNENIDFGGTAPQYLGEIAAVNVNGDSCDIYQNIFMDPMFLDPANSDFHLQEDSPCIDAGDPNSPLDPDSTIADIGALFFDQRFINVYLNPVNPPIQIPAGGGEFQFDITIHNSTSMGIMFDAWIETVLPDSSVYGPLFIRQDLTLDALQNIVREGMTQSVPGSAQVGSYLYIANAGTYGGVIAASDTFEFEKLTGYGMINCTEDWFVCGWDEKNKKGFGTSKSTISDIDFSFFKCHPNPFNQSTAICFQLTTEGNVDLSIYDITGRLVESLVTGHSSLGKHNVIWNAKGCASGVYLVRLDAGDNFSQTKKMVLVK